MDEANRQRLDKIAQLHAERYGDRGAVPLNASGRIRAKLFARWVGTGKRLLEVGCGSGAHLEYYCRGNDVIAMDVDKPALEVVSERLGVKTVWGDFATSLPFDSGTFDAVVAGETLEHMPYPTIFLGEIRRVLRPGGLFVGSVPNAYRYRNRLDVLRGLPIDPDPVHVQFFSLASLHAMLSGVFEAIEIVPVRGKWSRRFPSLFAHKLAKWGPAESLGANPRRSGAPVYWGNPRSVISPSSPTSTTARPPSSTPCSGSPGSSARTRPSPSGSWTRWTSSARRASPSWPRTRP